MGPPAACRTFRDTRIASATATVNESPGYTARWFPTPNQRSHFAERLPYFIGEPPIVPTFRSEDMAYLTVTGTRNSLFGEPGRPTILVFDQAVDPARSMEQVVLYYLCYILNYKH